VDKPLDIHLDFDSVVYRFLLKVDILTRDRPLDHDGPDFVLVLKTLSLV
jgi:hypothetical protein